MVEIIVSFFLFRHEIQFVLELLSVIHQTFHRQKQHLFFNEQLRDKLLFWFDGIKILFFQYHILAIFQHHQVVPDPMDQADVDTTRQSLIIIFYLQSRIVCIFQFQQHIQLVVVWSSSSNRILTIINMHGMHVQKQKSSSDMCLN